MSKRQPPTREETAAAIEEVANRVEAKDFSFDVQLSVQAAQEGLVDSMNVEGLQLLNRVSLMLLTENGTLPMKYEYVRKQVESMPTLDSTGDSEALRTLAAQIRADA